ncbi:Phosphoribosylformylglycinamidine synthase, partial [Diplonema papillatum]
MLVLASNNHCSPAQIVKALALINTRLSTKLSKLAIQTHHYIDLKNGASELSTEDLVAVSACLDYGYGACNAEGLPWTLTVLPRPGTITPWSSKATEILALCLHPSPIQRIEHGTVWKFERELSKDEVAQIGDILYDRMTQIMVRPETPVTADILFHHEKPRLLGSVPLNKESLEGVNAKLGLALQADEIEYILASWPRDPTDVELMMFAQVNSEHCRHKIFNASWTLDGKEAEHSLFQMIKNTYKCNPEGVLSAYSDNAAVLKGHTAMRFFPDPASKEYGAVEEPIHIVCKVETHNHPTAVSPFPGAATGVGGEIRDEGATGIGGKPKAGLTGFSVSHLLLPGAEQPWEDRTIGKPNRIASALQIMLDAPIGGARFNNEFGRPNVCGYFR